MEQTTVPRNATLRRRSKRGFRDRKSEEAQRARPCNCRTSFYRAGRYHSPTTRRSGMGEMTGAGTHDDSGRTAFAVLCAISFCHLLNDMMQSLLPAIYPMLKASFAL